MKNIFLTKTLCLIAISGIGFSFQAKAQIDPNISGNPQDFRQLENRTLIVEVLEPNQKMVDKLTKKHKTEQLKLYNNFISTYNSDMKAAVSKYWTLNKNIEYKTESELKDIIDKSNDYAIIAFLLSSSDGVYTNAKMDKSCFSVPIIVYDKSEKNETFGKAPDYQIFFPPLSLPAKCQDPRWWIYGQSSFDFVIREMQDNIEYILKTKQALNYQKYAKKLTEEGKCAELQQTTLVLQKNRRFKRLTDDEIHKLYTGKYEFVNDTDFDNAFANETSGEAEMFVIPFGIATSGQHSIGPLSFSSSQLAYMKIVIDCKTGDILYAYVPGGFGGNYLEPILKQTFKEMAKCKD